jgi:hypothetical protein
MSKLVISETLKDDLIQFLRKNKKADLVTTYLYFIERKYQVKPVLFAKEKTIYQSQENLIHHLEKSGKLWRETEIKIQVGQPSVNEQTQKIYICPYTGKAFGDNTCPNPQDAIYDWVSKCPENKERIGGLPVKRFYVSEDPEVIKNYIGKKKEAVSKIVFSSVVTGKLFNSRNAVVEDFTKNQLKSLSFVEVPNQNRFQIEEEFLKFIQTHLDEANIASFVEALSKDEAFSNYLDNWLEEEKDESASAH